MGQEERIGLPVGGAVLFMRALRGNQRQVLRCRGLGTTLRVAHKPLRQTPCVHTRHRGQGLCDLQPRDTNPKAAGDQFEIDQTLVVR